MRLVRVRVAEYHSDLSATCKCCSKRITLRASYADLDGPSFASYYCGTCASWHLSPTDDVPTDIHAGACDDSRTGSMPGATGVTR